jgi:hypothetical protein
MDKNDQDLERCSRAQLRDSAARRPLNTKKAYNSKAAEYTTWCNERNFKDTNLVTASKVLLFLKEEIESRGNKRKKNENGTALALSGATYEQYMKALCDLWKQQVSQGKSTTPHPRKDLPLTSFLKDQKRAEDSRRREQKCDRGAGTIVDGYNAKEKEMVQKN